MSDSEMLNAIRKKFVGSGDEHELLARLCGDYQAAYDKGARDRETEVIDKARSDTDALRFAQLLSQMNYQAMRFIDWSPYHDPSDNYSLTETAIWLESIGRTPEQLRKLADAIENRTVEASP